MASVQNHQSGFILSELTADILTASCFWDHELLIVGQATDCLYLIETHLYSLRPMSVASHCTRWLMAYCDTAKFALVEWATAIGQSYICMPSSPTFLKIFRRPGPADGEGQKDRESTDRVLLRYETSTQGEAHTYLLR